MTKKRYLTTIFTVGYAVLALLIVPRYFLWDAVSIAGLLVLPFCCSVEAGKFSLRYAVPAILLGLLALLVPVRTLLFLALVPAWLLLIENTAGRTSTTLPFLLLVTSPVFSVLKTAFGFPVRLWLSKAAAVALSFTGTRAVSSGNLILMGSCEYAVDEACAGLNMLTASFIITLFVSGYLERRNGRHLGFLQTAGLMAAALALNIVCNLFRIVLLVKLNIPPESVFHDLVGMFCLLLYTVLPLLALCRLSLRYASPIPTGRAAIFRKRRVARYLLLHLMLFLALFTSSFRQKRMDTLIATPDSLRIDGFSKTRLDGGILKFENPYSLVYVKPTRFYLPDHDPKICWRGSGYEFTSLSQEQVNGSAVYTARLRKGADVIYAAWWYDTGKFRTIDPLDWRIRGMNGERFYLVNVNAATPAELRSITTKLMNGRLTF